MKRPSFQRLTGLTTLALLATFSSVSAKKGGGGKPGGGGEDPPPPPEPAPIEYELTWFSGFGGSQTEIYDVNSLGLAVGSSQDANGTWQPFVALAGGAMTPLNGWWQLPAEVAGGTIIGREFQINENNQVSGRIEDAQGNRFLFLADLDDPASLDVLPWTGSIGYLRMNEKGDLCFGVGQPSIYVRSEDQVFLFPELAGHVATDINDDLQIVLNSITSIEWTYDTYRFTFDPVTDTGVLEDLEANLGSSARSFVQHIDNNGNVFGFSENRKATAGFVGGSSLSWTRIDPALPTGNSGGGSLTVKASAVSANESGQILGGFNVLRFAAGTDLWLQDPADGLLTINDLVVGNAADVQTFRSWQGFRNAEISKGEPVTGYGIIAGTLTEEDYGIQNTHGFILTPRLVQP